MKNECRLGIRKQFFIEMGLWKSHTEGEYTSPLSPSLRHDKSECKDSKLLPSHPPRSRLSHLADTRPIDWYLWNPGALQASIRLIPSAKFPRGSCLRFSTKAVISCSWASNCFKAMQAPALVTGNAFLPYFTSLSPGAAWKECQAGNRNHSNKVGTTKQRSQPSSQACLVELIDAYQILHRGREHSDQPSYTVGPQQGHEHHRLLSKSLLHAEEEAAGLLSTAPLRCCPFLENPEGTNRASSSSPSSCFLGFPRELLTSPQLSRSNPAIW